MFLLLAFFFFFFKPLIQKKEKHQNALGWPLSKISPFLKIPRTQLTR